MTPSNNPEPYSFQAQSKHDWVDFTKTVTGEKVQTNDTTLC